MKRILWKYNKVKINMNNKSNKYIKSFIEKCFLFLDVFTITTGADSYTQQADYTRKGFPWTTSSLLGRTVSQSDPHYQ